jgi:hypothetical protein
MVSIININHIIDNLYASSKEIADDIQILELNSIKIIISLNNIKPKANNCLKFIFNTEDNPNFDMTPYFDKIYDIIINNSDKNVLVHCDAGVSRTGSIIIYYLMKKYNYSYNQSISYTISKRSNILLNPGFELSLRLYDFKKMKQPTNNLTGIHFIYYSDLITVISIQKPYIIIGLGNGMNYGNYTYFFDNNIDDLLYHYPNIEEIIYNNTYSILIYGTKYIIDICKNMYYKSISNINQYLTNEEIDKIDKYNTNKYINKVSTIDFSMDINHFSKAELIQLSSKIDNYQCKNYIEKNEKKNLITKIEKRLLIL